MTTTKTFKTFHNLAINDIVVIPGQREPSDPWWVACGKHAKVISLDATEMFQIVESQRHSEDPNGIVNYEVSLEDDIFEIVNPKE